ncbi:Gamma-glutamyl phosphate reductase [Listeria ivanovii subsp. londoniensis]|uniref:Gamma-glutamyl phosphate reductase n=2 Tax=Listeria ivanovii TaxID=1638 RepID=A0ABS1G481_LISIV|nr:glutamate-5-semialdehyde dehydrogenase [Listeria ivanovii]EFR97133.1 glutamate-5-semialdehyde dehydrogenase [Listeria ivanovii FSL F6-596]AIS59657.1 gamma-glutamyl phosphate reductase [Listeria ivanovii subsp. londoniensis]MBK1961669.1 glutamate-5-semialdehyde dehydrogenase [Listeria ivanovii subsp. londoniensis]MBK2003416.1 glutamate-5-semialdehyde dehydrogenase [Listeria ivanovii subsp. londoniensis]MBM5720478.1 glutamate-5-semialdehyde dehydrogenase [Listeria ivanovii]
MTELIKQGNAAKEAALFLAQASTKEKNAALLHLSDDLLANTDRLLIANEKDIVRANEKGIPETMVDRLRLTEERIKEIAEAVKQVVVLKDPIGEVIHMWKNDAELTIGKTRVPLGVIGIIYESRPNVTVDASVLCFKTGNAVILRGGSDAINSNKALMSVIQNSIESSGFPRSSVQLIEDTSRETARDMMRLNRFLDVLIPRGGAKLIQTVLENATVPVIETGTGNCHIYVDKAAEKQMAIDILINAKCSRPSVCNAAETLLIHREVAEDFLPAMEIELKKYQVELRADDRARLILTDAKEATESDWEDEFLDFILAVKVVDSADEAIEHINKYGTKHSEAIVSNDYSTGQAFQQKVDAAAVYINASTRFTDGFAMGFGAEIGISTQKLHARGPMGLTELTSTKYIIFGDGQIRN